MFPFRMFDWMQLARICIYLSIVWVVFTEVRCVKEKAADYNPWSISLRWIPAYQDESWDNVRTGLLWSFSFLGATRSNQFLISCFLFCFQKVPAA
ncbi:MAG: hypothetical protein IPG01_09175 [Chitinophagaceae bacterium]|nr:hypothetical protein [Chitinophagaceae bacterium]